MNEEMVMKRNQQTWVSFWYVWKQPGNEKQGGMYWPLIFSVILFQNMKMIYPAFHLQIRIIKTVKSTRPPSCSSSPGKAEVAGVPGRWNSLEDTAPPTESALKVKVRSQGRKKQSEVPSRLLGARLQWSPLGPGRSERLTPRGRGRGVHVLPFQSSGGPVGT